ncbi:hypothetical protein DFS33DRAFT_1277671 [Desarmillaria ectypa]|nr:hypothetical protein DFS33DRAFT_1277671 [Desarmillaria ectypa]
MVENLDSALAQRIHAENPRMHSCEHAGCNKKFTRRHDVRRHAKIHLEGEPLAMEKYACLVTETGCDFGNLQLSNLKAHIGAMHPDVKHLICFDCRPTYRRFEDTAALTDHVQAGHLLTQKLSRRRTIPPSKPYRKITKHPQNIVSPLPPSPVCPPLPTDRFPLPPTAPPPQKATLPLFITIPASAFPKEEPERPRDPSRPQPQWYRAPQPPCHSRPRISSLRKKTRNASSIKKRVRQLPSPAPSGGGSSSTSSRFPSPPRPITRASAINRLPSPYSSGTSSPTHKRVISTPTDLEPIQDTDVEARWISPRVWRTPDRLWE